MIELRFLMVGKDIGNGCAIYEKVLQYRQMVVVGCGEDSNGNPISITQQTEWKTVEIGTEQSK